MYQSLPLNELRKYRNFHVIERYKKEFPANKLNAEQAFEELMKFFWLNHQHFLDRKQNPTNEALDFQGAIHHEMKEIDDMWHTFLLFTKDYAQFCQNFYGYFIHHQPNVEEEATLKKDVLTDLERYLSYIYDHLGEKTVRLWFNQKPCA